MNRTVSSFWPNAGEQIIEFPNFGNTGRINCNSPTHCSCCETMHGNIDCSGCGHQIYWNTAERSEAECLRFLRSMEMEARKLMNHIVSQRYARPVAPDHLQ